MGDQKGDGEGKGERQGEREGERQGLRGGTAGGEGGGGAAQTNQTHHHKSVKKRKCGWQITLKGSTVPLPLYFSSSFFVFDQIF